jgi:isocitrate dehydrogenase
MGQTLRNPGWATNATGAGTAPRDWGYALAAREFGATPINGGPWLALEHEARTITIKDVIAGSLTPQVYFPLNTA